MKFSELHRWDITPEEAMTIQREWASRIDTARPLGQCDVIAGADIAYDKESPTCFATVVVLRLADGAVLEAQDEIGPTPFPYVPGLLSFREAPPLLRAFARLTHIPDVVLFDGQGIAHPRRFGLASHMGLWLGIPTLGCAKSRYIGSFDEPLDEDGAWTPLIDAGETIGAVLRTRAGVRPLFVSPGHLLDLDGSIEVVRRACRGYRLPETTRLANSRVNDLRHRAKSVGSDSTPSEETPIDTAGD